MIVFIFNKEMCIIIARVMVSIVYFMEGVSSVAIKSQWCLCNEQLQTRRPLLYCDNLCFFFNLISINLDNNRNLLVSQMFQYIKCTYKQYCSLMNQILFCWKMNCWSIRSWKDFGTCWYWKIIISEGGNSSFALCQLASRQPDYYHWLFFYNSMAWSLF